MTAHATDPGPVDFTQLYREHRARLVNYAARLTRTRDDAEDAVQEAFLVALAQYDTVQPTQPLAWLTAVTRRRALESTHGYRRTAAAGDTIELVADVTTAVDTNAGRCMADPDIAAQVYAVLDELGPRSRELIRLRCIEGQSWPAVSAAVGMTPRAAQQTAYRVLRRLLTAPALV